MKTEEFYGFWSQWFAQPLEEKLRHRRDRVKGTGFYYPMGSEQPGYTGVADPKEYVHIKAEHIQDGFPETCGAFFECFQKAQSWCKDHGLAHLNEVVDPFDCVLRIIHYPPNETGNVGQAHVDFDLLTVSIPGTVPGLEVWEPHPPLHACVLCTKGKHEPFGGDWHQREAFEVHVGEMLEIYTQSEPRFSHDGFPVLTATPHRVRTPPNTDRLKAVFFYLPPMDFELRPGFTAHDYLLGPNGVLLRAGAK